MRVNRAIKQFNLRSGVAGQLRLLNRFLSFFTFMFLRIFCSSRSLEHCIFNYQIKVEPAIQLLSPRLGLNNHLGIFLMISMRQKTSSEIVTHCNILCKVAVAKGQSQRQDVKPFTKIRWKDRNRLFKVS